MATKTWKITDLQRELADGYVNKAFYACNGKDGDYEWSDAGEVDLPRPSSLVPYADLTESTVIGWVKAKLDADKEGSVSAIETNVDTQVDLLKPPSHGAGVPW